MKLVEASTVLHDAIEDVAKACGIYLEDYCDMLVENPKEVAKRLRGYAKTMDGKRYGIPTFEQTRLETWFERDRANVRLVDESTTPENDLINVWDDEVKELVEDGFLDPRHWHKSAYDWFLSLQRRR